MTESVDYLTIGKVVDKLKDDYPDLTISKIRFLEDENLLNLPRTKGGYRKFSQSDIDRLEIILRMQKDLFLPLDIIKEKLQVSPEPILRSEILKGKKNLPDQGIFSEDTEKALTLKEFKSLTGLSNEEVKLMINSGILKPDIKNDDKLYSRLDADIVKTVKSLSKYGIEPRHLRMYANFTEREADFFKQIVLPALHSKNKNKIKKTEKILTSLWKSTLNLKNQLLKQTISDIIKNELDS